MRTTRPSEPTEHAPVVVVGARCAGASTAMLLGRQGHDVLVLDRADLPSDTLSTHAIARGGVVQLARWGLLADLLASGAPPIRRTSFHVAGTETVKPVKHRAGVEFLLAPRRHVLDAQLLAAAEVAGVRVQTGVSVVGTVADASGRTAGVVVRDREGAVREIAARFLVGADGLRSRVARSVRAGVLDEQPPGGSTQYAYVAGLDAEGFEFHLGSRSFAGVFPTHGGEANVWVCAAPGAPVADGGDRTAAFLDLLERTSEPLARRVRAAQLRQPVRGATDLPNRVLEAAGPGWALVGDAGYHRDAISGHGITDAFRDAELLARHLDRALTGRATEAEAMADYASERLRCLTPTYEITTRLSQHPPIDEFVELQKRLSSAIEAEAEWLARLPPLDRQPAQLAA